MKTPTLLAGTSTAPPARVARWATLAGLLSLLSGSATAQFQVAGKLTKAPYPQEKIGQIAREVRSDGWIYFKDALKEKPQHVAAVHKEAFGLGVADELRVTEAEKDELGVTRYRYTQYHGKWPVEGADFSVYGKNEKALFASGRLVQTLGPPQTPAVSEAAALKAALASVPAKVYQWQVLQQAQEIGALQDNSAPVEYPKGQLLYALSNNDGDAEGNVHRLAYRFEIMRLVPEAFEAVYIDALTGRLLRIQSLVNNGSCQTNQVDTWYNGNRHVGTWWDSNSHNFKLQDFCRNTYIYTKSSTGSSMYDFASGFFITAGGTESNAINTNWNWDFGAKSAASTHYSIQAAHWYFKTEYGRNGPANRNRDIRVVVNNYYSNAVYFEANGVDNIVIGRWYENGATGNSLSETDIVAHEFTHGVVKTSAGLSGGEAAALNESFADIFGEMVERYNNSNNHDWVVGGAAGLRRAFAREINPATGQAQVYQGQGWDFSGQAPHRNGGVQNRWFYLLSVGVPPSTGIYVPAIGEDKAARIAYRSLTRYLGANSNYASARAGAIQAASDLYGACSTEVIATTNAWAAVGVGSAVSPYCASQITGVPDFCLEDGNDVYAEYRVETSPQATITWSVNNQWFVFSQIGQVNSAVLTQVPTFATSAILSAYIQFPNPTENIWRYYGISTINCRQEPPYCPPGQLCPEVPQQQRAAGGSATDFGQDIRVFPNPANTALTLELAAPNQVSATVIIRDLLGRTLHSQVMQPGQQRVSLDVSKLPIGSFAVSVITATGTTVKRFQIVH